MKISTAFKSVFLVSVFSANALLSGCSVVKTGSDQETVTKPAETQPQITLATEANVPDRVVDTLPPTQQTPLNTVDTPATSPTPATAPSSSPEPQATAADGMIIDDWQSGLDLSKDNPDDLYSAFGIDRTTREGYYTKICSETQFPIIHITTENNKEILSLDDYVNCFVDVMNCDDIYKLEAKSGGIRVRGNASANYGDVDWIRANSVSYRLKFNDKQSMLGLNDFAKCRSWVLLKSYEGAIENHLAFKVARAISNNEYYCSDSVFVQLYVNEKYMGPYLLCEQTQANSNRVDINEAEENYGGTDIGYLVELDNYATGDDHPYFFLNYNLEPITDVSGTSRVPRKYAYSVKNDLYSDEQLDFIERYFELAWEIPMRAIKYGEFYKIGEGLELLPAQDEFASAYDCINAVIDINSVVDMYMTYEIINDQDVGGGSFFFAVDFGADPKYERVTMLAPWDFDWAYYDYSSDADGGLYAANFKDSYFVDHWGDRSNPWLILFYSADWFRELVKQKWQERLPEIRAAVDDTESLIVNYTDEFNLDGTRRSGSAKTTINWVRDRLDYLNGLWG